MLQNKINSFSRAASEKGLPDAPTEINTFKLKFIKSMVNDEMDELMESEFDWQVADALVDAIYYIYDFAGRNGINLDKFIQIVHAANMSKIVNGQVIRETEDPERIGKILKPEGWVDPKPLLEAEYKRQIEEGCDGLRRIYIASPYSSPIPEIMETRVAAVHAAVGFLSKFMKDAIYSPIVHFHEIAQVFSLPTDAMHWRRINEVEMDRSDDMFVLKVPGWKESVGVNHEIGYAKKIGLVLYELTLIDVNNLLGGFNISTFTEEA